MLDRSMKESPFFPGKPVAPEYFIAREKEVSLIRRYLHQTTFGRNENVFIIGERGMGKSSLAWLIKDMAEKEFNYVATHCHMGSVNNLEQFVQTLFPKLLADAPPGGLREKLTAMFGGLIKSVGAYGVSIEFKGKPSEMNGLVQNFLPALLEIYKASSENGKKGLAIVVDDLNGITNSPDFSHFIKSFVDGLATSGIKLPLLFVLCALPEKRAEIIHHNPSVARIFNIIDLQPLSKIEATSFYTSRFRACDIEIEYEEANFFGGISEGYPTLMHELGDAVFWIDLDNLIDESDAYEGFRSAVENVGTKYMDRQVFEALNSKRYLSILEKIGTSEIGYRFNKSEIAQLLLTDEIGVLNNFLLKMKKVGLLKEGTTRGEYKFANFLYYSYVRMRARGRDKMLFT